MKLDDWQREQAAKRARSMKSRRPRNRRPATWCGRTLARVVKCEKCSGPIGVGETGYKRAGSPDVPGWTCERCVT